MTFVEFILRGFCGRDGELSWSFVKKKFIGKFCWRFRSRVRFYSLQWNSSPGIEFLLKIEALFLVLSRGRDLLV